jgi:hypothetical protein
LSGVWLYYLELIVVLIIVITRLLGALVLGLLRLALLLGLLALLLLLRLLGLRWREKERRGMKALVSITT